MINLYPFLIYVFVTTFTPGPNNIMSMSNAMHYGYQRTIRFLIGIFVGFMVVMMLCGLINVALAAQLPSLKKWLNILGAVYMLYLAYHILRSKPVEDDFGENGFNSFKAGFTMQFLNIKVILYGITVFSLFIIGTYQDPMMICLFSLILAGVGYVSTSCWAFGGNLFRNLLRQNYRIFNFVMGGLLIYSAIASLL
jgi:cysteine/O-acetylserine efflux protein